MAFRLVATEWLLRMGVDAVSVSVGPERRPVGGGGRVVDRDGDRVWVPPEIDTSRPHPARVYDYLLGGKDHFEPDRVAGDAVARAAPFVREAARGNRAFLSRAVTFLAARGVDQFLDIGAGLPAAGNVHEVAQRVSPAARVVYVDNDPVVLSHAQAILATDDRTIAVRGDLRVPGEILTCPAVRAHLDFTRPVAVLLVAIVHFVLDEEDPAGIVASLRDALPGGSYLVLSHATNQFQGRHAAGRRADALTAAKVYSDLTAPFLLRDARQIQDFFRGWTLASPGLVPAHRWRPDHKPKAAIPVLAAVAHRDD
jgi:hypothetical protein